ncbi:hypothetical protein Tco_1452926 [Tanacetum coccineum]
MWQPSDPNLPRRSSRQSGIRRLTIGLTLSTLPEPFKMLKIRQRARSSVGRDPDHLLSSEISSMESSETREYSSLIQTFFDTHTDDGEFTQDEARVQYVRGDDPTEGSRRQYADGYALHRGQDNGHDLKRQASGHIPGVGRVFAGQDRDAISTNEPRGAYTDADVDEIKEDNKRLRKELAMLRTVVTSDDRMSQLLTSLESQHEACGGSGGGRGGDDEPAVDEEI